MDTSSAETSLVALSEWQKTAVEVWRPIPGCEGYEASSLGAIASYRVTGPTNRRLLKRRILKPTPHVRGYARYYLRVNGKKAALMGHRLVAITFLAPVQGRPTVNHKNNVHHDNRLDNLEWMSTLENVRHAVSIGVFKQGHRQA